LIQYQAPKHHNEARTHFEAVLKHNPAYGSALVGLGLILEEQGDYSGAVDLLNKALAKDPENVRILAEAAWCNVLDGNYSIGQEGLESSLAKITGVDARSRDLKAQILWRIGTCLWNADGELPFAIICLTGYADWSQWNVEMIAKPVPITTSFQHCKITKILHPPTQAWASFTLMLLPTPPAPINVSRGHLKYQLVKYKLQSGWREVSPNPKNGNWWKSWHGEWLRQTRRGLFQEKESPGLRARSVLWNWYVST
jgi:tetratricopeptide (TPR) repeat protein